jgi:hypothetical protein
LVSKWLSAARPGLAAQIHDLVRGEFAVARRLNVEYPDKVDHEYSIDEEIALSQAINPEQIAEMAARLFRFERTIIAADYTWTTRACRKLRRELQRLD